MCKPHENNKVALQLLKVMKVPGLSCKEKCRSETVHWGVRRTRLVHERHGVEGRPQEDGHAASHDGLGQAAAGLRVARQHQAELAGQVQLHLLLVRCLRGEQAHVSARRGIRVLGYSIVHKLHLLFVRRAARGAHSAHALHVRQVLHGM